MDSKEAEIQELKYEIYGDDYYDGLKDELAKAEVELKAYSTTECGRRRDVWEVNHNERVANTFENLMKKIGIASWTADDACDFIMNRLKQ